jgi:D-alanyl-D-alanine dipeptidase
MKHSWSSGPPNPLESLHGTGENPFVLTLQIESPGRSGSLRKILPLTLALLTGCASPQATAPDPWQAIQPGLIPLASIVKVANPLPYETSENLAGQPIYPPGFAAQTRPEVAAALRQAARKLSAQGYQLVVLDAWRPAISGAILSWSAAQRGHQNLVATPEISGHARAISVDVTVETLAGAPVPMPSTFDFPAAPGVQTPGSRALREAMHLAGFTGHRSEWWHFDYRPLKGAPIIPGPPKFGKFEYRGDKLLIR